MKNIKNLIPETVLPLNSAQNSANFDTSNLFVGMDHFTISVTGMIQQPGTVCNVVNLSTKTRVSERAKTFTKIPNKLAGARASKATRDQKPKGWFN